MKGYFKNVKSPELYMIQFALFKLIDLMVKYQGLEKTLQDIRNAVKTKNTSKIPKELTEMAWKASMQGVKLFRVMMEELKNKEK